MRFAQFTYKVVERKLSFARKVYRESMFPLLVVLCVLFPLDFFSYELKGWMLIIFLTYFFSWLYLKDERKKIGYLKMSDTDVSFIRMDNRTDFSCRVVDIIAISVAMPDYKRRAGAKLANMMIATAENEHIYCIDLNDYNNYLSYKLMLQRYSSYAVNVEMI